MADDRGPCQPCSAATPRHVVNDTTLFIGFSCSGCNRAASPAAAGAPVITCADPQLRQLHDSGIKNPPWECALCLTEVFGWRNICPKCNTPRPAITDHGTSGTGNGNDGQATPSVNSDVTVGADATTTFIMRNGRLVRTICARCRTVHLGTCPGGSASEGAAGITYPALQRHPSSTRHPPWQCAVCLTDVFWWRNVCLKCNTPRPAITDHGTDGICNGSDGQALPSLNRDVAVGVRPFVTRDGHNGTAHIPSVHLAAGVAKPDGSTSAGAALYPQVSQRVDTMDLCVSTEDEVADIVSNGNMTECMDVGASNAPPTCAAASVDVVLSARQATPCSGGAIRSPWAESSDQRDESMDYGTPPPWCHSPSPPRTTSAMEDNACERCATAPCECTDDDCERPGKAFLSTLNARRL
jgi:hypothetical protein